MLSGIENDKCGPRQPGCACSWSSAQYSGAEHSHLPPSRHFALPVYPSATRRERACVCISQLLRPPTLILMSLLSRPTVSQHVSNPGAARFIISRVREGQVCCLCSSIFFSCMHPLSVKVSMLLSRANVPAADPVWQDLFYHLPVFGCDYLP